MSAPFKFKLKVKGPDGAAPSSSQPHPAQPGQLQPAGTHLWPPTPSDGAPAGQPPPPAASKPFKFKLKVSSGAPQAPAEQPAAQHWDAPQATAAPPPPHVKAEAGDDGGAAPRPVKKIKLSTGDAAGVVKKKPIIKFKPPPKQPRDAAAAAAVDAAVAAEPPAARGPSLPIVRLTLPAVSGFPAGNAKRPKAKGLKAGGGGGGGVKKGGKLKAGGVGKSWAGGGTGDGGGGKRAKRSRSDLKELRDLGIDEFNDFDQLDDLDYDPGAPIAPRTFTLRSSQPKAEAGPSSAGMGLSGGGAAPSDAHTGFGGAGAMADTAGTQGREDVDVFASLPPLASAQGPAGPPKREEFERLLARCQKKDVQSLFKEPVTEVIAPGYFEVVKQPMDFSTMRGKAQRGEYGSWDALRADMRLMFTNALKYNAQGGTVHNYAKLLMGQCDRIVELAMQGKTDFRSSATITRKHNAAVKAQQRAEREQLRAKARAEQRAALESKVLKKAGLEQGNEELEDESVRHTYRRPLRDANMLRWRGVAGGATAEGVAWGPGQEVLRPTNPWLPPGSYAASLKRFAAGLKGKALELVMRRATASMAADKTAERALQLELAKKVPQAPPPPVAAPSTAPGRQLSTGQQQPAGMQAAAGGGMAAVPPAMLAVQQQQQMMMQAAAGRGGGQMMSGMMPRPAMGQMGQMPAGMPFGLAPGCSITMLQTPSGPVPFLLQPGQQPIMMSMPPGAGKPGMMMQPGFQPNLLQMQQQQAQQQQQRPRP